MNIFDRIDKAIGVAGAPSALNGWTSLSLAHTYACIILGMRPEVTLELGVWCGRGSIAMALAHKEIGIGHVYAVDAWEADASVEGQVNEADRKHWSNQPQHYAAHQIFLNKLRELELETVTKVIHSRSTDFEPPENLGLLVVDGNHGEQCRTDVAHYAPHVKPGGLVYMDDLEWSGGAVKRASEDLKRMGFKELYQLDRGPFYQRI